MVFLEFIGNSSEILQSLDNFNKEANEDEDLARMLIRKTIYWVYDSASKTFGPNKFVAFRNMTVERYGVAKVGWEGASFNGTKARLKIEEELGSYSTDNSLHEKLIKWAESLLWRGILKNIPEQKWKFTYVR